MRLNFNAEPKFFDQAKLIYESYRHENHPEEITENDFTPELIKQVDGYWSYHMYIQMLSDDLKYDGEIDWNDVDVFDEIEEDVISETCHRLKWFYQGKTIIHVVVQFFTNVLKIMDTVRVDNFKKHFL